jgi:outer membrane protein
MSLPLRLHTPPRGYGRFAASAVALCAAALLGPGEAASQPDSAPAVTLGAVLETALRQSPSLELARIDVTIADARALQAAGIDDWLLTATAAWLSNRVAPVGELFQTTASDALELDVDLERSLPTGGTFGLHGSGLFRQTTSGLLVDGDFDGFDSEVYRSSVVARLYQPLLAGRGRAVARADRRLAEVEQEAAALDEIASATFIVRDLIQAYWELGYARSDLEIRESSLELARERLRITEAGVQAGAVAPSEILAVQQVIATREEEVEQARLNVTRRSLDLRRLAGMPIGPDDLDIVAAAPVSVQKRELPMRALVEEARAQSPEIAAIRARGEGAEIEVEVTANGLLPRLDATLSFGPSGTSSDFGDTLSQIATLDEYRVGASLTYQHALGRRAARGAHAAALGRLSRVKIGITDAELQITAAVVESVRVAETAARRLEISERAIGLAEQNIEAEVARFELGRSTNFDVLERQDELKRAQLLYARAGVDYVSSLANLDALTGEILEAYGITLESR